MTYRYKHEKASNMEKILIGFALASLVISFAVIFSMGQIAVQAPAKELAGVQDLSIQGFVPVKPIADLSNGQGLISLTGGCYRMTAGTDVSQAESIKNGLEGLTGSRPNTHEVVRDAFKNLNINVLMVKVTELKGDNFFGKIILQQGNTVLSLDARPSDGIALAIRTGSPIYFNETLLKQRGEKVC